MMRVLLTGAAGFIGARTAETLCERGFQVTGFDNLSDYYDTRLKQARLDRLSKYPSFQDRRGSIESRAELASAFDFARPTHVVHLAAQAGAGASITNPARTVQANLVGFADMLEECRHRGIEHLVFASSSSAYGLDRGLPFSEHVGGDHPITLYGATKRANELMAHAHAHLFNMPCTALRFFTVYGPWGRPDMAFSKWSHAILRREPIKVFNQGRSMRDFTYIDDVVEAIGLTLERPARPNSTFDPARPDPATSSAPFRVYNVACGNSVPLLRCIRLLEDSLGVGATLQMEPLSAGDVPETAADISDIARDLGFRPTVRVEQGIPRFAEWYRNYHGAKGTNPRS